MALSTPVLEYMLLGCIIGLNLLAAFFLRGRQLSSREYFGWGIFALILPIFGPFIVIWVRPGLQRKTQFD